jgi:hypothetical protein
LHPERAEKYDYCMAPECQKKNLKGLAMVAVGVNKSAEQYLLLDGETRDDLARGKYHDQRRAAFGTSVPPAETASPVPVASSAGAPAKPAHPRVPAPRRPAPRRPWSRSQEKLARRRADPDHPRQPGRRPGLATRPPGQNALVDYTQLPVGDNGQCVRNHCWPR